MVKTSFCLVCVATSTILADGFQPIPLLTAHHLSQTISPEASASHLPFVTKLRMGVMEDFLSGADKSKRESDNAQYLATLQQRVERINAMEGEIEDLGDDKLTAKSAEFQQRLKDGEDINGKLLEEAFAVVREAAW